MKAILFAAIVLATAQFAYESAATSATEVVATHEQRMEGI